MLIVVFVRGKNEQTYHDTWALLRKCRDVVWGLEVSVCQIRNEFRIDYGKTTEDFLKSV